MRGDDQQQGAMFSYLSPKKRVSEDHPLRAIRAISDPALKELSSEFDRLYAVSGRPSIAPEKLLRALLLHVLYTIRSERLLMEQLDYNLLFRWFVGLNDEAVWVPTVFSNNRDRLLAGDIASAFFEGVVGKLREKNLLSDEHFTVDGTLLEAWAGAKSFRRKDGKGEPPEGGSNPTVNFHGEQRSNATHESTTDWEARLATKAKGKEAKLSYAGHVLMENRNGLIVTTQVSKATGTAESEAALEMAEEVSGDRRVTLGGEKGYDQKKLVEALRRENVTPHVARNEKRPGGSAIDKRTSRHEGYEISQRVRKRVEEIFGWMKTIGLMRKLRHRGEERLGWKFTFTAAVYNLVRARNLLAKASR
ncbi:MAG: IS5 family transposase [Candidatus Acidiferrum sp.]